MVVLVVVVGGFGFCVGLCVASPYIVGRVRQEVIDHTEQAATRVHVHVHVVVVVIVVVVIVVVVVVVHDLDILDNQHDHVDKSKSKCEVSSNWDPLHS